MLNYGWLTNLSDFLQFNNIGPNMLLFFSVVVLLAFIFSLREFTSWMTKTSRLSQDIEDIRESQRLLEQKLDIVVTRTMTELETPANPPPLSSRPEKEHPTIAKNKASSNKTKEIDFL